MYRLILAAVIIYLLYKSTKWLLSLSAKKNLEVNNRQPVVREDLVEDPQCHTYVPMSHAHKAIINGKTVYFCSQRCLEKYRLGQ